MKNQINYAAILATGIALAMGANHGFAIEITVRDNASALTNGWNGGPFTPGFSAGLTLSNHLEDNEVERTAGWTAQIGQAWDNEAFVLNGTKLSIVSGFNLSTGYGGYLPGDLFIKVGAPDPGENPTTPGTGDTTNLIAGNYTWAVDLSLASIPSGASTTKAYRLNTGSILSTVAYDAFLSNPWTYKAGASYSVAGVDLSYNPNQTRAQVAALTHVPYFNQMFAGVTPIPGTGLKDDSTGLTASHNVLEIDLGDFLGAVAPGTTVYFSYTMQCGNDSLKGEYGGGFDRSPDGGASVLLLGLALAAMSLTGLTGRRQQ